MTREILRTYRLRCDAAQCTVSVFTETTDIPAGWTTVDSIAHQSHAPLPSAKAGRKLLRALDARGIRSNGRFRLHLCPAHPDALAGHLPQTDNSGGHGSSVFCFCGARLAGATEETKTAWVKHYEAVSSRSEDSGPTGPA